jgi:hypothetical protein
VRIRLGYGPRTKGNEAKKPQHQAVSHVLEPSTVNPPAPSSSALRSQLLFTAFGSCPGYLGYLGPTDAETRPVMTTTPIWGALGSLSFIFGVLSATPACGSTALTCGGPSASEQSCLDCINSNCSSDVSSVFSQCSGAEGCLSSCSCNDAMCAENCTNEAERAAPRSGSCSLAVDDLESCEGLNCYQSCIR